MSRFQNIIDSRCLFWYMQLDSGTLISTFLSEQINFIEQIRLTWDWIWHNSFACYVTLMLFLCFNIFIVAFYCSQPMKSTLNRIYNIEGPRLTLPLVATYIISNFQNYLLGIKNPLSTFLLSSLRSSVMLLVLIWWDKIIHSL